MCVWVRIVLKRKKEMKEKKEEDKLPYCMDIRIDVEFSGLGFPLHCSHFLLHYIYVCVCVCLKKGERRVLGEVTVK